MALSNTMAYSSAAGQGESNIVTSTGSLRYREVRNVILERTLFLEQSFW